MRKLTLLLLLTAITVGVKGQNKPKPIKPRSTTGGTTYVALNLKFHKFKK